MAGAQEFAEKIIAGDIHASADLGSSDIDRVIAPLLVLRAANDDFEQELKKMARLHDEGKIDHVMPAESMTGPYANLAVLINELVKSHMNVKFRLVDLLDQYSQGNFTEEIENLPGLKHRITETANFARKKLMAAEQAAATNLRIVNALDNCSTSVMIADARNHIVYMNKTVTELMRSNAAEIRSQLPLFDVNSPVG